MSSNGLHWLARSGGHGYSSTLHAVQNAILLNLENFNYVKMKKDGSVVAGTGALFQQLIDTVSAAGRELSKLLRLSIQCADANLDTAVGSCGCVVSDTFVPILPFQAGFRVARLLDP